MSNDKKLPISVRNRAVKRAQLKAAYHKFCESWKKEKKYQLWLIAAGEKLERPQLGRKPSFIQWQQLLKVAEARLKEQSKKAQEEIDLEWEEDEVKETPTSEQTVPDQRLIAPDPLPEGTPAVWSPFSVAPEGGEARAKEEEGS